MTRTRSVSASLAIAFAVVVLCSAQCRDDEPAARPIAAQDPAPAPPPDDRVRLLVSGAMLGRLEPCGCASGQLGGLPRRMQHVGEHRGYDLLLEGGDLVDGHTPLDLQKAFTAMQVLFGMQRAYDALGVGPRDLALPLAEWSSYAATAAIVATDLQAALADWPGKPFVEKQVRNHKVRILSFATALPEALQKPGAPVTLLAPAAAWQRGLAGADPATLRILLFHGGDLLARRTIAALEPRPDLVLCFDHGYTEAPAAPELVAGVPLVFPGIRGRVLLDLWLARTPQGPRAGYELVMLAGSKTVPGGGGDPDVKLMLKMHREQVKEEGVLAAMAGQLPTANGAAYVGSQNCRSCHATAFAAWQKSKHAHAWQTLVDAENDARRYGWPVTAYPDCVSCHVVGYRERTGFVTAAETPALVDVGCERCHGAGSDHVVSGGKQPLGKVGGGMASVVCTQCHDFEQSPNFLYGEKWPLIEHGREPDQQKPGK